MFVRFNFCVLLSLAISLPLLAQHDRDNIDSDYQKTIKVQEGSDDIVILLANFDPSEDSDSSSPYSAYLCRGHNCNEPIALNNDDVSDYHWTYQSQNLWVAETEDISYRAINLVKNRCQGDDGTRWGDDSPYPSTGYYNNDARCGRIDN